MRLLSRLLTKICRKMPLSLNERYNYFLSVSGSPWIKNCGIMPVVSMAAGLAVRTIMRLCTGYYLIRRLAPWLKTHGVLVWYTSGLLPTIRVGMLPNTSRKIVGRDAADEYGDREAPFALMSKKIGQKYALKRADQIKKNLCVKKNGKPAGLPRYYRKILGITTEDLMGKAIERQAEAKRFIDERTIKRVSDPSNLVDAVYNIDIDTSNQSGITKNEYIFAQRRQIEKNYIARFSLTDQRKRDLIK